MRKLLLVFALMSGCSTGPGPAPMAATPVTDAARVTRVTTAVPFPRGLAMKDSTLYVLSRGRVRDAGGTDTAIADGAGTLWAVAPDVSEPLGTVATEAVRTNAQAIAVPTDPPFRLLDTSLGSALEDTRTDRPYCILRYDAATASFFFCAFSGIDKPIEAYAGKADRQYFRKNNADAVYRYDTRTARWHLMYRNAHASFVAPREAYGRTAVKGRGAAPTTAPQGVASAPDPFVSGPDNCLVVGKWLYVVAKETSTLIRMDLSAIAVDPSAEPGLAELLAGQQFRIDGEIVRCTGHSMLAHRDGYLYLGFRTTSQIIRIREADLRHHKVSAATDLPPIDAEIVATFDPFDPETGHTADLTDMAFGPANGGESVAGSATADLYVVSAKPARVYRFTPNPGHVFDARTRAKNGAATRASTGPSVQALPWADLAGLTGNPKMKGESLLVTDQGVVFVTSADAAPSSAGTTPASGGSSRSRLQGIVYRISP